MLNWISIILILQQRGFVKVINKHTIQLAFQDCLLYYVLNKTMKGVKCMLDSSIIGKAVVKYLSPSELTEGAFGDYNSKLFKHFNIYDEE